MSIRLLVLLLLITTVVLGQSGQPSGIRRFMQGDTPSASVPYGNNSKAGHYVTAGDARIYYEVYGKGSPVVVLQGGIFGSTVELAQLIDSLTKTNQVIAVSTRGHGRSELGSDPLSYEQRANDVMAVIKATTTDSVMVIGFSDGGYTGYKLAGMYPNCVKKLVVIGAGELYPGMRTFEFNVDQAKALDPLFWKQQLTLMPEPDRLAELFTGMATFYNRLTVGKALFQTIQCPVLVMAGDRDETVSVQHLLNTVQQLPNGRLAIVPDAGHTVFLVNYPAVWASIRPFLSR